MNTTLQTIQSKIMTLPNRPPFMLAQDLAELYETATRQINQAVKRNPHRFPEDFCFRLTDAEWNELYKRSQSVISPVISKNVGFAPYGFTREGANVLSMILKSPVAVQRSIQIIRAFTRLEEVLHAQRQPAPVAPAPAPAISDGQIVIEKDRLIEMQQDIITLLKAENVRLNTVTHKRFTPEEEQTVLSMTAAGRTPREIAAALKRPPESITSVLRRHRQ